MIHQCTCSFCPTFRDILHFKQGISSEVSFFHEKDEAVAGNLSLWPASMCFII